MQKIIKRMQDRIMQHQKENGFETIFDFLNEDLDELQKQLKNCNLQSVMVNKVAVCSLKNLPCDYKIIACKKKKTDCICRKVMQTEP